jgi:hypothetical protein
MDGRQAALDLRERALLDARVQGRQRPGSRFKTLPERERPTFHEIRGLGSRLYLERGRPKSDIQELAARQPSAMVNFR